MGEAIAAAESRLAARSRAVNYWRVILWLVVLVALFAFQQFFS